MEIGYCLSSEEHSPNALVDQAVLGEQAGMTELMISDHFHPWLESQGHSSFVWAVLGGIARATGLTLTTGVTCPTVRIHPAIIAHAAATVAVMTGGKFRLGVGSGENLNEHILGDGWPEADVRISMLEESIDVIRQLWQGGFQSHYGEHYIVQNARVYDLPDEPPPIVVSAFGPKAARLAGRVGDGLVITSPDAEVLDTFDRSGGSGKPKLGSLKVCYGEDEAAARRLAFEIWRNSPLPGELAQELPMPAHFEQASELVTEDMVADAITCGNDPEQFVGAIDEFAKAGFDIVYIQQVGPDQAGFLDFFGRSVRPRLS